MSKRTITRTEEIDAGDWTCEDCERVCQIFPGVGPFGCSAFKLTLRRDANGAVVRLTECKDAEVKAP